MGDLFNNIGFIESLYFQWVDYTENKKRSSL